MRVLALADRRPPMDPAVMATQAGVDAVLCLGDLDRAWIESLQTVHVPRLGVHGNHDPEHLLREVDVEDLHLRRTSVRGMTFAGFEGCVRYARGEPHQYTQRQGARMARRLPAADVLLCHCRHLLHGHTHPMGGRLVTRHGDTRVHWISGARILSL
jgi:predicted phosphodiesterase